MKRMNWMAIAALFLLTTSFASAQSLGDVARSTRKGKTQTAATNHKFDNDNLPKGDHLSVVGPSTPANPAATDAAGRPLESPAASTPAPSTTADPKAAAEDRQKAADDLKDNRSTTNSTCRNANTSCVRSRCTPMQAIACAMPPHGTKKTLTTRKTLRKSKRRWIRQGRNWKT